MSTSLAIETPLADRAAEEVGHAAILHSAFETDRLDPARLDAAQGLPVRQFRLLAATPRHATHQACDDGVQLVQQLKVDGAVLMVLDLPPGSRYRLTAAHPEGLYVDFEPAAVGTVHESTVGGSLRIVSRRGFTLDLVSRRLPEARKPALPQRPLDPAAEPMVRQLLDVARSLWITPPTPPRRRTSAAHVLEVVEQVLAEQPYGVLHPSDFATPARISVRSLERAMQRAYGMGPKRWITNTRLNTAHRHLRDPGPEDRTVAQIARRCGFLHAGRFSQAYRALFGDYPHEVMNPPLAPATARA